MDTEEKDVIQEEQELNEILKIRREKLSALQQEGKDPYLKVKYNKTDDSDKIISGFELLEGKTVTIAGRMMSKRIMGKASFANIQDGSGTIQLYVRRDELGEDEYIAFKAMDIGDIIGAKGEVFKTHTGEISIKVNDLELLSKSLLPLPEKFHGLKDTDLRYRQRYVDLIVNPEVKRTFILRSNIIKEIRAYLDNLGFLEVDTPILNTIPGGAAARPFITHHNTLDIDMYLRIATELHLKRLIVGGFEKVYEMGRIFRNEGMSVKHNPEFTTIELYQAYTDYAGMMELSENMVAKVAKKVLGTTKITYQGNSVDLTPPWRRIKMCDAVKETTGYDFMNASDKEAREFAEKLNLPMKSNSTKGELLYAAFENHVEETLIQPTFILDYPVEVSPLAKRKQSEPWLTERFELFITGREMANAFSELNDPIDQKERFAKQAEARKAGDLEANMMDEDYINALEYGMPPTGGLGIGIDRLVMLLTDSASIRDVLLFPTMKQK
ncbi:MAG: lysine--tRNA ligase [Christensenellales bacterium]